MRITVKQGPVEFSIEGSGADDSTTRGRLRVVSTLAGSATVEVDESEVNSALIGEMAGPALREQTAYRVTLVNRDGDPIRLRHRNPGLIAGVSALPNDPAILSGTLNFGSEIGDTEFTAVTPGGSLSVILEVWPSKLDFESDYREILGDINALARELTLDFLRATTTSAREMEDSGARKLDWLLMLRSEIDSLEQALEHVASHPHLEIRRETGHVAVERLRRSSASTRRAIARGLGFGPLESSSVAPRHRRFVSSSVPVETADTNEHRWLRARLREVLSVLGDIRSAHDSDLSSRQKRGLRISPRDIAINRELAEFSERLAPHLERSPLIDAVGETPLSFSSLVFQNKAGYSEAYRSILRLRMAVRISNGRMDVSVRDLASLYEIWCYVAVVKLVAELLGAPLDLSEIFKIQDLGVRITLRAGESSRVAFAAGQGSVEVAYNREFSGLTGNQRPDVIVRITRRGLPPVVLILDAKYRLETSAAYVQSFGMPGPPVDAVSVLHRYRDAITVKWGSLQGRPVVRGIALFPLAAEDSDQWKDHDFFKAIELLGVGALPFLPSSTAYVESWLREALEASDPGLAWPGPPFLAQHELGSTSRS